MDTKVLEAKFTTHPPMHQNEGDISYFHENGTESLNQETEFDERTDLINLSEEVKFIENDSNECSASVVKFQPFEDPEVISKIKEAEKLIQKMNEDRSQIREKIEDRKGDRGLVLSQLKYLSQRDSGLTELLTWRRRRLNHLRQALDEKLGAINQSKGIEIGLPSSVRVRDDLIRGLHRQLLHGRKSLAEEKKLLREIKRFERTRDTVAANGVVELQDQIEHIIIDVDEMTKSQKLFKGYINQAMTEKAAIEKDIDSLHKELAKVYLLKREADTRIFELRSKKAE